MENADKKEVEESIINRLSEKEVDINIVPSTLDIIAGSVKTENVLWPVLANIITRALYRNGSKMSKRLLDILMSVIGLILLSPFNAVCGNTGPFLIERTGIFYTGTYWL